MNNRPKVLIAGAGPTGLVMAHELARDGIDCRVVDKSPHRAMESRAIAIHSRTMETFELMRLADDFLGAGHRIAGVNVYGESGRIAHAEFGMLDTRIPLFLACRRTRPSGSSKSISSGRGCGSSAAPSWYLWRSTTRALPRD